MANSMETLELQPNRKPEIALARTLAVFVSLGCLSSLLLAKVVPIFGGRFKGLEVDLPFATRFLVANYGWISALFVGEAVLPTVTEFLIPATRRLIITGSAFAATVALVVFIPYLPLIELARKAGQAK